MFFKVIWVFVGNFMGIFLDFGICGYETTTFSKVRAREIITYSAT